MEISVLEERANPLLKRTEYRFAVDHPGAPTPSRDAVREALAKAVKVGKERVILERMHARFGTNRSEGFAMVYQSVEDAKAVVRHHILVRNGLAEAKGTAASGAPAAGGAPKEA
ncbi:MAG: 30S ribosomal protein S24e [Thermoplasmata archaeon]